MPDKTSKDSPKGPAADIAKSASENTLALNPIVGIRAQDMAAAGGTVLQALASQPQEMAKQWFGLANEFASILTKKSEVKPEPRDRRFADPAW
jgi:polyhydroxyalkanoate synthase